MLWMDTAKLFIKHLSPPTSERAASVSVVLRHVNIIYYIIFKMKVGDKSAGYTTKRVLAITGVPYQTLNLWAKTGLIQPSIADAAGSGTERVYGFRDLVALKVAVALRSGGVTTKSLFRVIRFLQEHTDYESPLSEARLVVTASDVLLVRSNEELISTLRKPGQSYFAFVVDLPKAVIDVFEADRKASAA